MRRPVFGPMMAYALLLVSCVEQCPFEVQPDYEASTIFMGVEPTCEQREIWYRVRRSATAVWGIEPEQIHVWFLEEEDQLVYLNGEVTVYPGGGGLCIWSPGRSPDIYVASWYDPLNLERVLCHELTHVYWRILDHNLSVFQELEMQLLEEARSRNPDYPTWPSPWTFRVTGEKF